MTDWFAGIDVGSSATKAVVYQSTTRRIAGVGLSYSAANFEKAAQHAYQQALTMAGIDQKAVGSLYTTGYGRENVAYRNGTRTEIDCHARGAYFHYTKAMVVVDIGGQDNKVIQLDEHGRRLKFSMNRKCAAGTGSFLEELATRLRIKPEDLNQLATQSQDHSIRLGSFCTVFAMTEILARIRQGVHAADLARAAFVSVAQRIVESHNFEQDVVATGGVVAHNPLMGEILSQTLSVKVDIPPYSQHVGALGAALSAAQSSQEAK